MSLVQTHAGHTRGVAGPRRGTPRRGRTPRRGTEDTQAGDRSRSPERGKGTGHISLDGHTSLAAEISDWKKGTTGKRVQAILSPRNPENLLTQDTGKKGQAILSPRKPESLLKQWGKAELLSGGCSSAGRHDAA